MTTPTEIETPSTSDGFYPLSRRSPAWMRDVAHFLPVRSHFVLTGNVADTILLPMADGLATLPLRRGLSALVEACGYDFLLCYDPFDGYELITRDRKDPALAEYLAVSRPEGAAAPPGSGSRRETPVHDMMRRIATQSQPRGALLIEHSARLGDEAKDQLFGVALKLSRTAIQMPMPDGRARFAPVFWLADSIGDIPSWFTLRNERVRAQAIQLPTIETRQHAAEVLAAELPDYAGLPEDQRRERIEGFARSTDGFTVDGMVAAATLAEDQGYGLARIQNAVRLYKLGVTDNPWEGETLRRVVASAEQELRRDVKGQGQAIRKAVSTLVRSIEGLGAAGKPRGVLFLAGPTGVGKTELAKSLARILFSSSDAYIRFDMSEFAQEHNEARLVGSPPGYVGYGAGGELTRAVSEKPFSVILFDEIEKAHPRLFDKFLQILDDGRLTDGEGRTAWFSESIIIFTSNLGIYRRGENGQREQHVHAGLGYEELAARVKGEIEVFFKEHLGRPELFGRLGDKVVVFDFISESVGREIFRKQLDQLIAKVREQRQLELSLTDSVLQKLETYCVQDRASGGRGIGARLESALVDPLAVALFARPRVTSIRIVDVDLAAGTVAVE